MRVGVSVALVAAAIVGGTIQHGRAAAATATATSPGTLVNAVPAATTPNIEDGTNFTVDSYLQVGSLILQGGTFTTVDAPGKKSGGVARTDLFAADATTGAVSTSFVPVVDGAVDAMVAGPTAGTVFIGGEFDTVDGVKSKSLALINVSDGSLVTGWKAPVFDGIVQTMAMAQGRLVVGGTFSTVSGAAHAGIAAINVSTYAVDPFIDIQLAGHHNYDVNCTTASPKGCADAPTQVQQLAVSPDDSQMMIVGNFTSVTDSVATYSRDQVARILLGSSSSTVDANWATQRYTAACYYYAYDSYLRGVAYSPDGSYFAIVATGGGGKPAPASTGCDSVARYETSTSGQSVQPTWLDYAGNDTIYAVAVSSSAVYIGGHERWLNNANGSDSAGAGALPRPGLAALDPANGLPYSWNPGRNPRGAHVSTLYLAPSGGLWVGGDTDYIGNRKYYRGKDSFFPATAGETLPAEATQSLPDNVYIGGTYSATGTGGSLSTFSYDGTTAGTTTAGPAGPSGTSWNSFRGAFMVDGNLYYAYSDGNIYTASFDGTTFGAPVLQDPYDDPTWDDVQTGSGQTYQGLASPFNGEIATVTGLTYSNGYLFYTISGKSGLYYRYFEPEDGLTGATEFTASTGTSLSNAVGLFVSGGKIYWANKTNGYLMDAAFSGPSISGGNPVVAAVTGTAVTVNTTRDWRSRALFLAPAAGSAGPAPTASFIPSCTNGACTFDSSGSTGTISSYAWTFGDGGTSTAADPSHTYTAATTYSVSLTVTDSTGRTASSTQMVTIPASVPAAAFTSSCSAATCTFNAGGSSDNGGTISSYSWDFGDGTAAGTGVSPTHTYTATGNDTVVLTVTDNLGATSSVSHPVSPTVGGSGTQAISFIGSSFTNGSAAAPIVKVPAGTAAGDLMLLFVTVNGSTTTVTGPAGWTPVGSEVPSGIATYVYEKTATASDPGSSTSVSFNGTNPKSDLELVSYRGVGSAGIRAVADTSDSNTAAHTTPGLASTTSGDWVVSYWADKSSATTSWSLPSGQTQRSVSYGSGSGYVDSMVTDYGGPVATSAAPQTAVTNATSGKATEWTVELAASASAASTPTAAFTSNCSGATCTFNAGGSTDSGGTISTYAWNFGDGATGTGVSPAHTYAATGSDTVTLTVTDNLGATSTVSHPVSPTVAGSGTGTISFVGASITNGSAGAPAAEIPSGTTAGDLLLLFVTVNGSTTTVTGPAGWTLLTTDVPTGIGTYVYEKTATATDPGTSASVSFGGTYPKSDLELVSYSGVSSTGVQTSAQTSDSNTAAHTTPGLATTTAGDLIVSYWGDKSSTTSSWTPPTGQTQRSVSYGSGSGYVDSLVTDDAAPSGTSAPALTAVTNTTSGKATELTLELAAS